MISSTFANHWKLAVTMIAIVCLSLFMLLLPALLLFVGSSYTGFDYVCVAGGYLVGFVPALYLLVFVSRHKYLNSRQNSAPSHQTAIGLAAAAGAAIAAPFLDALFVNYLPRWVLPALIAASATFIPSVLAVIHFKYERPRLQA